MTTQPHQAQPKADPCPPPPRAGHRAGLRTPAPQNAPQGNVGPQEKARRFFTSNPTRSQMLEYLAQAAGSDTLVVM